MAGKKCYSKKLWCILSVTDTKGKDADILESFIKEIDKKAIRVGWFPSSKYPNNGPYVAEVALIQEMGSPSKHIPPRPFIRPTITNNKLVWQKILVEKLKTALKSGQTPVLALQLVGEKAAGDVRQTISTIFTPPLSPKTIKARVNKYKNKKVVGNLYKPLIETGYMLATCSSEVVEGE
jgi:hypothetical protein